MTQQAMVMEIKEWIYAAAEKIRESLNNEVTISQKSGRTDLVTNIDKETQAFLIDKIREHYPEDRILAEEEGYSELDSLEGRVWIIDPIDGTLNFVMERENFCIMLGFYENGVGQLGFIYDVMQDELFWGGKGLGVYMNKKALRQPKNLELAEGLLGMNAYMYGKDINSAWKIGHESMGVRVSGCAGLEMIAMLKGNHIGYLSNLSPWDYAPGLVLLEEFGFKYAGINGDALRFSGREYFLAATPKAFGTIQEKYLNL
ncbi:inositol monophosphatase family protein [Erwinia sp. CPCC 100877]|nr:inositol monophosphatase family protein [Erwinia sp. CPCC 100877]